MSDASRVFVACAGDGVVEEYRLAAGVLERTDGRVEVADVRSLAFDAARSLLYALGNGRSPECVTIDVAEPGAPRAVHRRELPATTTYAGLGGSWLLSASYLDSCAVAIALDADGLPTGREVVTHPGRQVHCLEGLPGSDHVYAVCLRDDTIRRADARFDWTTCWRGPVGRGPRHLRFRNGRAYVVNELTAHLDVFDVDATTGDLAHRASIDALPGTHLRTGHPRSVGGPSPAADAIWAADVDVTPDGRFAVLTERTGSTLSVIDLDAGSVVGVHPTERRPRATAVDTGGRYLLTAGELSGRIEVAELGPDGSVSTCDIARTGAGPLWLTVVSA